MGAALRVEPDNALLGVARRLFGVTKPRSSRLDQRVVRLNRTHEMIVHRPSMAAPFELWIGRRYVRSRSGNRFVSMISATSMLGIAIAVAVLIVVLSVVNGFEQELRLRLLAMSAHATIESPAGRLTDWRAKLASAARHPEVTGVAP